MPIIDHATRRMSEPADKESTRWLVSKEDSAKSLTIREIVIHPGSEGRLHTHPADQALMVMEGSIQMIVGEEVRTVRRGFTLLAPPEVPHMLINNTWAPARILVIEPTCDLEANYLE